MGNRAQKTYESAVEALNKYCEKETDLMPAIRDEKYPFRVQFIPNPDMFTPEDNVDENGEVNDMTVTVGLDTTVRSSLKFKMNSNQLKKLIKTAETVGDLYYRAFREEADNKAAEMDMEAKQGEVL